jgi:hypothetical protein
MPKNVSQAGFQNIFENSIRELKDRGKQNRTDQLFWQGFFPLVQGVSTTVEALPGVPDGAMYYATDLNHIRALINSVWTTVV